MNGDITKFFLKLENTQGNDNQVQIAFYDEGTDGFDDGYDGRQLTKPALALWSIHNNEEWTTLAFGQLSDVS
ncbi:hypothetical protein ACFLR1_06095, partial [Bacteroidota bacterium]